MMVAFFSVGTVLQTVAMRGEQMAITYIVVLGFEAITALALSMILLHEGGSLSKFTGAAFLCWQALSFSEWGSFNRAIQNHLRRGVS